jgi:hypothetical protein
LPQLRIQHPILGCTEVRPCCRTDGRMNTPLERDLRNLLTRVDGWVTRLTEHEPYLQTQKLFRIGLFAWLFLHTMLLLPFHQEVFGPQALIERVTHENQPWLSWLLTIALRENLQPYYMVFVIGQLVVLAAGILGFAPRLMVVLAYLLTMNLNALTGVVLDGGNNLSQLLLVYLIFINTSGRPTQLQRFPTLRNAVVALSNAAFFVGQVQVALVYACAGIYKLNGELWQSGMALYYLLQAESYTHPWVADMVFLYPWLPFLGTYFTLAFQFAFPTLIWIRSVRPWLLAAGVLLHLGIAFVMGLFTFGLVMIVSYVLFLPNELCARVLRLYGTRRLRIRFSPHRRPVARLVGICRALDIGGRLQIDSTDAAPPARPGRTTASRSSAPLECWYEHAPWLRYTGYAAVARMLAKLWVLLPFAPLLALMHYAGIAQRLCRMMASRDSDNIECAGAPLPGRLMESSD